MLFDGHSDLLYGMNRLYQRGQRDIFRRRYGAALARGPVMGGIFVLWSNPQRAESAAEQLAQQLNTLRSELASAEQLALVRRAGDLAWCAKRQKIALVLGIEGLDGCAQDEAAIDWLYEQGVRHVSLTWNGANGFASGVQGRGGLTAAGRRAVRRVQRRRMVLDVAHLNDQSMSDLLRLADGPVIASHCNSRRLCQVARNLTDQQAKAIAAGGGVIGVNSHPPFIGGDAAHQDLQHLADHIVYFAELLGAEHVGLGLDLNYWDDDAAPASAAGLNGYGQCGALLQILAQRGFHRDELRGLCRENFLRVLRQVLA